MSIIGRTARTARIIKGIAISRSISGARLKNVHQIRMPIAQAIAPPMLTKMDSGTRRGRGDQRSHWIVTRAIPGQSRRAGALGLGDIVKMIRWPGLFCSGESLARSTLYVVGLRQTPQNCVASLLYNAEKLV